MDETLTQLVQKELVNAEQVLAVGVPSFAHGSVTWVQSLEDCVTPARDFDAALWRCEQQPIASLPRLRARLRPGARLLVLLDQRRGAWERVRHVVAGRRTPQPSFEDVCEALLLSGLEDPRVLHHGTSHILLGSRIPAPLDALDQVFSQRA